MDGPATISQLVQEILDFISQVLVLPLDNIQLLNSLIPSGLEAEHLAVVVPALLLAGINLGCQVINLGLPFTNNLVKVLGPLLSDDGSGMDALILQLKILQVGFKAVLGLLSAGNLLVQRLNSLLSLSKAGHDLSLGSFQLINTAKTFSLILRSPQLDFSLGLGQSLEGIRFLLILLINAVLQALQLSVQALELAQQGSPVSGLSITHPLGVLKLGGERDLVLAKSSDSSLGLLNLAGQILILDLQLLPGGVGLIEGTSQLIKLLVGLNNQALGELAIPLIHGPLPHGLIKSSSGLLEIPFHTCLVLLSLGLHLVEAINLLTKFTHVAIVFLAKCSKGSLVGNVGFLQLSLQLSKLSFPLLVQLNLSGGVVASILELLSKILDVSGQERAVLLSLSAVLALNGQLLVKLFKAALELLDLTVVLASKSLLVINLSRHGRKLLLLALNSLSKLTPDALQVGNSLLGQLQVSLNLALDFLNIRLGLLFPAH